MKKLLLILAFLILPHPAFAQATNPCENPELVKVASISISTATTTKIVDNGTNTQRSIVPCIVYLHVVGVATTANSATLISGTGATCGTGTTTITGALLGSITVGDIQIVNLPYFALGKIKLGDSFCITSAQTGVINGFMTYYFVGQANP